MIRFALFTTLIFLVTKTSLSKNIAVVDIESIIDNNISYINILKEIQISQTNDKEFFIQNELKLEELMNEIENSKLILNNEEMNTLINTYNIEYNKFNSYVEEFNLHYQEEVFKIRKLILKEIIVLLENYAKKNNVDLVLDSTSYLIASNSLNITKIINDLLNELNLKLEFEHFEKN